MADDPMESGKQAWDQFGQFIMPEVGKDDPQGRATLYLAGYYVGYQAGLGAAMNRRQTCHACGGRGQIEFVRNSWGDCPACGGKGY